MNYHVLLNGQHRCIIVLKRELCQGDHCSPLIFILYTEPRVRIFNHAKNQGKITEMSISCASPSVAPSSAEDNLFFSVRETMKVVRTYEKALGKCINFDKSSLLSGKRMPKNVKQSIKSFWELITKVKWGPT